MFDSSVVSAFEKTDWESVPDDPFAIPDNSYTAYLTKVETGPTKNGDKIGITLTYTIEDGPYSGRDVTEWKQIPQMADPQNPTDSENRMLSFLKARMRDLGVPPSRIPVVTADDLVGLRVVITTRQKGPYTNVHRVQQISENFVLGDDSNPMIDFP